MSSNRNVKSCEKHSQNTVYSSSPAYETSIFLACSSPLLREMLVTALHSSGYPVITEIDDFSKVCSILLKQSVDSPPPSLLIICSIMPQSPSDFQTLVKNITTYRHLRCLPLLFLSNQIFPARFPNNINWLSPFNLTGLIVRINELLQPSSLPHHSHSTRSL